MSQRPIALLAVGVVAAAAALFAAPATHADDPITTWSTFGNGLFNQRNAGAETAISPATVGGLSEAWIYTTGGDVSATPAVSADAVFAPDWGGKLSAVDRFTGAELWQTDVQDDYGLAPGDIIRATPALDDGRLYVGDQGGRGGAGATMLAVDQATGELLWKTKVDEHPFALITQSAVVFRGTVYVGIASLEEGAALNPGYECCTFRGSVVALDANTGQIKWRTYVAPDVEGVSGNAVWGSTPVVDHKRGSLYITTGNNYTVPDSVLECVASAGEDEAAVRACMQTIGGNYFDALLSLDLDTGAVKWATTVIPFDAWTVSCFGELFGIPETNCPDPAGPDHDFGQGAMLYKLPKKNPSGRTELLAAGQKSGRMWALDPATGQVVWQTQVGPGGELGGLQWGSSTDGRRIYTAISNSNFVPWQLQPGGPTVRGGFWSGLDASTGEVLWQAPGVETAPGFSAMNMGPTTVANGVVFGAASDPAGTFVALDAATGARLWSYPSGGSSISGAAVADGQVFWGSGYAAAGLGPSFTGNNKLYAFGLG